MTRFIQYNTLIFIMFLIIGCNREAKNGPTNKRQVTDEQLMKMNKYLVEKDKELIQSYIKRRNWDMQKTGSGLWYMVYKHGEGRQAKKEMYAIINYTIELLDGTLCYTSDSLGTKKFLIGNGNVEPGLQEGILLMQEGDKARFIMPPHLAHHLLGDENKIPARSTIVYDVELLKITND